MQGRQAAGARPCDRRQGGLGLVVNETRLQSQTVRKVEVSGGCSKDLEMIGRWQSSGSLSLLPRVGKCKSSTCGGKRWQIMLSRNETEGYHSRNVPRKAVCCGVPVRGSNLELYLEGKQRPWKSMSILYALLSHLSVY